MFQSGALYFGQVQVSAFDDREPPKSSSVMVTVSVIRDESVPEFIETPFTATVSENTVVNTVIFTIVAQDSDLQVRQSHNVTYRYANHTMLHVMVLLCVHRFAIS